MTDLLNVRVPLWQLMILLTGFVVYKELVKIGVKRTLKAIRKRRVANAAEPMPVVTFTYIAEPIQVPFGQPIVTYTANKGV